MLNASSLRETISSHCNVRKLAPQTNVTESDMPTLDREYVGHAYRGISRTAFLASALGLVVSSFYRALARLHWDDNTATTAATKHKHWKYLSHISLGVSAVAGVLTARHRLRRARDRITDRVQSRF